MIVLACMLAPSIWWSLREWEALSGALRLLQVVLLVAAAVLAASGFLLLARISPPGRLRSGAIAAAAVGASGIAGTIAGIIPCFRPG
jgi:hypothetical protein